MDPLYSYQVHVSEHPPTDTWRPLLNGGKLTILDTLTSRIAPNVPPKFTLRVKHLPSGREIIDANVSKCIEWLQDETLPLDEFDSLTQRLLK